MRKLLRFAAASLVAACAAFAPERAAAHGFEQYLANLDDTVAAGTVNGEEMSVGRMKSLLALRTPPPNGDEFLFFGVPELLEAGREAPAWSHFAQQARDGGIALDAEEARHVDAQTRDFAERMLFRQSILGSETRPTVESLREEYDRRKDTEFFMPERFIVKEIFVPFRDGTPPEETEKRARDLAARFAAGEAFGDIQKEAVGNANVAAARIIVPGADGEVTPAEVIETVRGLADRATSEPFASAIGWHIVQRQLHIPQSHMPFEAVFQLLLDEWVVNARDEAIRAWFLPFAKNSELVRINTQYLLNTGALALDRDVLLSVGAREFTRAELKAAAGWRLNPDAPLTEATFLAIAAELGPVQHELLNRALDERGTMGDPEVLFYRQAAEDTVLARKFILGQENIAPGAPEAHAAVRKRIVEKAAETKFDPLLATGG